MRKSYSLEFKITFLIGIIVLSIILLLAKTGFYFLRTINSFDIRLFLIINRHHSCIIDPVMYLASDKFFWLPFYALLIYLLFRVIGKDCWKALVAIAFMITASDQISSDLIKNSIKRLRPSHETTLIPYIHLSKAGPGGLYGFISSHAANSAALTVFLIMLLSKHYWRLKFILPIWSLLVSYSRLYNGVHYPFDVLIGLYLGSLLGVLFYFIFKYLVKDCPFSKEIG